MAGKVFISYSRKDLEYVERLVDHLEQHGIAVWFDKNIDPGAPHFQRILEQRIDECIALVLVMTPHANDSEWVHNEVARAKLSNRQILPLLLSGQVFLRFAAASYTDVRNGSMPPPAFTKLLQDYQDLGSAEGTERSAERLLDRADGPVERYERALSLDQGEVATSVRQGRARLGPVPVPGTGLERLRAIANLLPSAVEHLEILAERATVMAERARRDAATRVAGLATAIPPPPVVTERPPKRPLGRILVASIGAALGTMLGSIALAIVVLLARGLWNRTPSWFFQTLTILSIVAIGWLSVYWMWLLLFEGDWVRDSFATWRDYRRHRREYARRAAERSAAQTTHEESENRRRLDHEEAVATQTRVQAQAETIDDFARSCRTVASRLDDEDLRAEINLILTRGTNGA